MSEEIIISKSRFKRMSGFDKGYTVYMHGCRDEQPNIPPIYNDPERCGWWQDMYNRGQTAAIQQVQDSP